MGFYVHRVHITHFLGGRGWGWGWGGVDEWLRRLGGRFLWICLEQLLVLRINLLVHLLVLLGESEGGPKRGGGRLRIGVGIVVAFEEGFHHFFGLLVFGLLFGTGRQRRRDGCRFRFRLGGKHGRQCGLVVVLLLSFLLVFFIVVV